MRTMKKSKMICAAVLTGVLGAAALAGCAQEMAVSYTHLTLPTICSV